MEVNTYKEIIEIIRSHTSLSKDCTEKLTQQYPTISKSTLQSIVSLEYQKHMKLNHHRLSTQLNKMYESYLKSVKNKEPPGIILRMSQKYNLVPAAIARALLGKYYKDNFHEDDPHSIKISVNRMFKDTTLIPDVDLAYEVYLSVLYDDQNGPISDVIRQSIGLEYELRLQKIMKEKNIIFQDEQFLRKNGYDKTPDIKLDVPIAINGFIINWVESKALFGNEDVHKNYVKDQYLSYWNRFGPGLVIYWFGYLESIINPNEKKFIIKEEFPENIVYMNPKLITHD